MYCGPTEFASGHWAGIALNEPSGKNDGSVGNVRYFDCEPKYGEQFYSAVKLICVNAGISRIPL